MNASLKENPIYIENPDDIITLEIFLNFKRKKVVDCLALFIPK